jgi:hypothetical protein
MVEQIGSALSNLDPTVVESRFDPRKFAKEGIYASPDEEEKDFLLREIENLHRFFSEAASARQYVLVYGH